MFYVTFCIFKLLSTLASLLVVCKCFGTYLVTVAPIQYVDWVQVQYATIWKEIVSHKLTVCHRRSGRNNALHSELGMMFH